MPSGLRRLAADHAALHEDLPPNYLHPFEDSSDDLTQLTTLLAGPQGTPYSQGLWRLHLKMPEDYPKSPPKATFRTRIWHPNVEESTGAVCVDTLKRDWKPTLTLKDVLITISCLLIYPNPDSALNSAAGSLLQENYEAFARQAKLMTSIHAPVPADMKNPVSEAKLRGEDAGTVIPEHDEGRSLRSRKNVKTQTLTMKKPTQSSALTATPSTIAKPQALSYQADDDQDTSDEENDEDQLDDTENDSAPIFSDDEPDNLSAASKENDPSLSPSPVKFFSSSSPRKNAFGKRPLSVLTGPIDYADPSSAMGMGLTSDEDTTDLDPDQQPMTASEKNIAANHSSSTVRDPQYHDPLNGSPQRKSPKLSLLHKGVNSSGRIRDDLKIFEDVPAPSTGTNTMDLDRQPSSDGKENNESSSSAAGPKGLRSRKPLSSSSSFPSSVLAPSSSSLPATNGATNMNPMSGTGPSASKPSRPGLLGTRKVSGSGTMKKAKPRLGIRRL